MKKSKLFITQKVIANCSYKFMPEAKIVIFDTSVKK